MSNDLISMRFITRMVPYSAGDLAGFKLDYCQRLIEVGCAVYATPPPGCDEFGSPLEREAPVEKVKTTQKKKEQPDDMQKRKSGRLGTVKK